MGTAKSIVKNTGFLFASEFVRKLLFFVLVVYATRILGKVDYGRFSFALAFAGMFAMIVDLGTTTIVIREIARDRKLVHRYFGNLLALRLITSVIAFTVIFMLISLSGYPRETVIVVYIAAAVMVLDALSDFFKSIYQAFERMEYVALSRFIQSATTFALGLLVLFHGLGLFWFIVAYLISSLTNFFFNLWVVLKKFTSFALHFEFPMWKHVVILGLPIFLSNVFGILYFRVDTIMLSYMRGDADVGIYSAAYQLLTALIFIPTLFTTAIFPVLSKFHKTSKELLMLTYRKSVEVMFISAIPIAVGTTILAEKIIYLLYGAEYLPSATALRILVWMALTIFLNYVLYNVLVSIDRQKTFVIISCVSAILNVTLNFYLIRMFGYKGAALATLITQVFVLLFIYHQLCRYLGGLPLPSMFFKPTVVAASMGALTYAMRETNILFVVLASAVFYLTGLVLTGAVKDEDKKIFYDIISSSGRYITALSTFSD